MPVGTAVVLAWLLTGPAAPEVVDPPAPALPLPAHATAPPHQSSRREPSPYEIPWGTPPPPPAPPPAVVLRGGDGMLVSGSLLAGACAAALPLAVSTYRYEATCTCSEGAAFCGCGLGALFVSPIVVLAAAPTLPLLWVGAWRRGRADVWYGFAAPRRLRALGWTMFGLGMAFAVAGGVTFSQTPSRSSGGTVTGSLLFGGAYAASAAGVGLVFYDAGRRNGQVEFKVAAGAGGLTLWF